MVGYLDALYKDLINYVCNLKIKEFPQSKIQEFSIAYIRNKYPRLCENCLHMVGTLVDSIFYSYQDFEQIEICFSKHENESDDTQKE